MSGVDVLSVLDDMIADMGDLPGTTGNQVALVRDAVAELIEAASDVVGMEDEPRFLRESIKYLRAALDNVTGGAA